MQLNERMMPLKMAHLPTATLRQLMKMLLPLLSGSLASTLQPVDARNPMHLQQIPFGIRIGIAVGKLPFEVYIPAFHSRTLRFCVSLNVLPLLFISSLSLEQTIALSLRPFKSGLLPSQRTICRVYIVYEERRGTHPSSILLFHWLKCKNVLFLHHHVFQNLSQNSTSRK